MKHQTIEDAFGARAWITSAGDVARRIVDRVPGWEFRANAAAWIATDPDPDHTPRWIAVDATIRILTPGCEQFGMKFGAVVIGFAGGMETRVSMPETTDNSDVERVISALVAVGALPDEHGMTH